MDKSELRNRIINTLENFQFSQEQLARINEILNE